MSLIYPGGLTFSIYRLRGTGLVDLEGLFALPLDDFHLFLDAACRIAHAKSEKTHPLGLGLAAAGSASALV